MLRRITVLALVVFIACNRTAQATPPNFNPAPENNLPMMVDGSNQFAFDLYRVLAQKPGNTFFSPYSISSVLTQTFAAASGETAGEMARTLHLGVTDDRLHAASGEVIRQLQGERRQRAFRLHTANHLWLQKGFTIRPEFARISQTHYQGGLNSLDFYRDPQGSRGTINRWVEDKTNNKIVDLLQPGNITNDTRFVLTNAIYFKADWTAPFSPESTRPEDFTIPGQQAFRVPMMHQVIPMVSYFENAEFQMVELPYQANEVSMIVILPKRVDGLNKVERTLSVKQVQNGAAGLIRVEVDLTLPKFKMTQRFSLPNALTSLGMKTAFTNGAEFSGLIANEKYPLKIDDVIHKAYVEVDEKGTEAAAATAVIGVFGAAPNFAPPPPPIPFKADHPFLFLIRHNATGTILFMGRVQDPRQS